MNQKDMKQEELKPDQEELEPDLEPDLADVKPVQEKMKPKQDETKPVHVELEQEKEEREPVHQKTEPVKETYNTTLVHKVTSEQSNSGDDAPKTGVRFAKDTKPSDRPKVVYRTLPPQPLISQSRHKVGKFNAKRDMPIFCAVFAVLFGAAFVLKDTGRSYSAEEMKLMKKKPSIHDLKAVLIKANEEQRRIEEGRRRKTECGLFLGESTIPSAGLSWYSGRNFEAGEVVIDRGRMLTEIVFENELFLKHHPAMVNIALDQDRFRATRPIEQGEELFLSVLQHPHARLGTEHPFFRNIPTAKDYHFAESILLLEADALILNYPPVQGNARLNAARRQQKIGRDKTLELVRNVAKVFNHRVANLLPSTLKDIPRYFANDRPFQYYVIQNRTVYWLEHKSHCMDDVVVRDGGLFAARPVKKGAKIVIAPLHVQKQEKQCDVSETCKSPHRLCFGHPLSPIKICPVTFASHMKFTNDIATSNAIYEFGDWNKANGVAQKMSADQVLTDWMTGLTLDIVATKNIALGDEVILSVADGKIAEYGIEMSDSKFPAGWRQAASLEIDSP